MIDRDYSIRWHHRERATIRFWHRLFGHKPVTRYNEAQYWCTGCLSHLYPADFWKAAR